MAENPSRSHLHRSSNARASNRAYVAPITDVSVRASDVGRRGVVGRTVLVRDWRDVDVWSAALWVGLYGERGRAR